MGDKPKVEGARRFPVGRELTDEETKYHVERALKHGRPVVGMFAIQQSGLVVLVQQRELELEPDYALARADTLIGVIMNAAGITMGVQNLPLTGPVKVPT